MIYYTDQLLLKFPNSKPPKAMHRVIGHAVDDVKLTFVGPEEWQEMEWSDGTVLIRTVDSTRVFIGKSNSTNRFMKVEQLSTNWKGYK